MSPPAGGSGPGVVRPRGERAGAPAGARALGMAVFLVSLGVLFAAGLVAYVVIRARAETWRPPGVSGLPPGLWLASLLLVGCSVALHRARTEIRRGHERRLVRALDAALLLAIGFVACQAWNWLRFFDPEVLRGPSLYGFTFFMLTGLHALHVVGGLAGLGFVALRARRGAYSWAYHAGVRYSAVYWDFLLGVWLVLFAVLLLG